MDRQRIAVYFADPPMRTGLGELGVGRGHVGLVGVLVLDVDRIAGAVAVTSHALDECVDDLARAEQRQGGDDGDGFHTSPLIRVW